VLRSLLLQFSAYLGPQILVQCMAGGVLFLLTLFKEGACSGFVPLADMHCVQEAHHLLHIEVP
jgi:hypothetical protein